MSHPKMAYDPVAWRRKRLLSQWATQITGIPETTLDRQARDYIRTQQSVHPPATESDSITFTILIGFHTHLDFFKDCINSVAAAASKTPGVFLELLIVNDDPTITTASLESIVATTELQSMIRTNHANLGICRSINESLPHVKGEWILYLDCDDRLSSEAIVKLQDRIRSHPGIRFISSRAVDLDESGLPLAYRLRDESPVDLIDNNYASHLKAIRKTFSLRYEEMLYVGDEIRDITKRLGVEYGQGFSIARPLPLEQVIKTVLGGTI
jgi:glycosyltransferase involved in cell wall biosynthesis